MRSAFQRKQIAEPGKTNLWNTGTKAMAMEMFGACKLRLLAQIIADNSGMAWGRYLESLCDSTIDENLNFMQILKYLFIY